MKVNVLKFMKNHAFHGNRRFSRKKANFTEYVMAMKSWIKLVPTYRQRKLRHRHFVRALRKEKTSAKFWQIRSSMQCIIWKVCWSTRALWIRMAVNVMYCVTVSTH